jgi:Co/Zn/Cd efflux system component
MVGGALVLAATVAGVAALVMAVAYFKSRSDDSRLTTFGLIRTTLLGALSMQQPALAAGMAVALAGLLAATPP